MFEIGFSELVLTMLVALLVIGPKQMPHLVKTSIKFMHRLKNKSSAFQQELEKELGVDKIKQQIHNSNILEIENKIKQELEKGTQITDVNVVKRDSV